MRCAARWSRMGSRSEARAGRLSGLVQTPCHEFIPAGRTMRIVARSAMGTMIGVLAAGTWHGARAEEGTRNFEIYGFAMADWIQDTKRVDPNWQDAFRPSKIAAPEGEFGTNGQSDLSVKQSRFGVKGTLP